MSAHDTTPVIVGIGELVDRPADPAQSREPIDLMAAALRLADQDSGGMLAHADSLQLVPIKAWPYKDPVELLCERLGLHPAERINAAIGGETPIRLLREAAAAIAAGEKTTVAIVGAEAVYARKQARKAKIRLDWTPQAAPSEAFVYPFTTFAMSPVAKQLGATDPTQIYALYETAMQAAKGQTPAEAHAESAALWARYAATAADNPFAWIRSRPDAETIGRVDDDNRMISWPYSKFLVANPNVNQAAAFIVTSLAAARAAGVPEERIVYVWGGAGAIEPEDYLLRDGFDHSTAQAAALRAAVAVAGGDARAFRHIELYSCFPSVPKMAIGNLGLDPATIEPSVAGGLTFFGGPMNNYMAHATCEMVRRIRRAPEDLGLLYGQGGYFNKHETVVLGGREANRPFTSDNSAQAEADRDRGEVPPLLDGYEGPAEIEAYTVPFGTDGTPLHGIVVARTPEGGRVMARVAYYDTPSISVLLDWEKNAVGTKGHIRIDAFGKPAWQLEGVRRGRPKFANVERDGHLTIITINRPETLNALTAEGNAEFAELMDEFAADDEQWVAIITGAGERSFSTGNDLKWTAHAIARGERHEVPTKGFLGMTGRFDLNKPVIAAVNGVAMGGGFELALACDIVVASSNATFALPEPRVGVAAMGGGLIRLPQQVPLKQAMNMILTGKSVSAEEGLRLGFVNEVTSPAELIPTARRIAEEILACSPLSVWASKEIVQKSFGTTPSDAYRDQTRHPAVRKLLRSSDIREGPRAFAEKRPPRWKVQ